MAGNHELEVDRRAMTMKAVPVAEDGGRLAHVEMVRQGVLQLDLKVRLSGLGANLVGISNRGHDR